MSGPLDEFAQTVYGAYSSFRVAGFDEAKAFRLAQDFLIATVTAQVKNSQE